MCFVIQFASSGTSGALGFFWPLWAAATLAQATTNNVLRLMASPEAVCRMCSSPPCRVDNDVGRSSCESF